MEAKSYLCSSSQQWTASVVLNSLRSSIVLVLLMTAAALMMISSGGGVESAVAFYADNGIDQTVVYEQMGRRERREMQQEILSLLGLHHRPRPTALGTENSAPKYMINLYRSFAHDEFDDDHLGNAHRVPPADHVFTVDNVHAINDADVIMSFVNHGWRRTRKCRRIKLKIQSKSSTCKRKYLKKHRRNTGNRLAHFRHERDRRFWFDVSEVPAEETIMEAELRLFKEVPENSPANHAEYNLSLYKIVQGMDPEDKELYFVDSINVTGDHHGWIKLNVTGAASDWVVFPNKNLGLYLRIQLEGHARELQPKEVGIVGNKGRADRQPFMVAFFKTSQDLHVRRTRAAQRKQSMADTSYGGHAYSLNSYMHFDPNSMRRSCQTRTLYVNFKDLGWQDWIIAPDGYAAFYCQGECSFPLNTNMNATNHAIVQTLVNLMKPETVPKPCCAPSKLSHISVLYYDDNSNVILKKYRNMVVRACGCH